ncbi:MAG: FAD-dependent oxidoreductase, partial [Pseudomonadota bacterium]
MHVVLDDRDCDVALFLDLPQQVDVAVIGGGVIGITAAWHLARDGYSVAVFEKGRIAGEQS